MLRFDSMLGWGAVSDGSLRVTQLPITQAPILWICSNHVTTIDIT